MADENNLEGNRWPFEQSTYLKWGYDTKRKIYRFGVEGRVALPEEDEEEEKEEETEEGKEEEEGGEWEKGNDVLRAHYKKAWRHFWRPGAEFGC